MASEDVSVKIGGDASGAKQALSSVSTALDGFKNAMQGLAGAFAFEKIASGFTSILAESSKADAESRRFINTMVGVGTASDPGKFFELADSLERLTGVEAEQSIAAGSMLARFGLTQNQIESLLPLTQDLAAGLGKDLAGAADDVGKAVDLGSVGLRGLNLGFSKSEKAAFDLASQSERVTILMERMQAQVGGTAAIMASTATGAIRGFEVAIGNVEEAFGGVVDAPIAGALQTLTGYVTSATEWFNGLSDGTKNLLGGMATGVAVIGGVASALLSVGGAAGALVAFWPAITGGLAAIGSAGVAAFSSILLPMTAMAAGVVGVILIVGALRQSWIGDLGGMRSFALNWIRDIKYLWVELVGFLRTAWSGFADAFREKFLVIKGLMSGLSAEQVGAQLQDAKQTDAAGNFSASIEDAFAAGSKLVESGSSILGGVWDDAKGIFSEGIAGLKDVFGMLGLNVDAFGKSTQKQFAKTAQTAAPEGPGGLNFAGDMGDIATSISVMANMAAISEADFQKILDSVDGNTAKAMQIAMQFGSMAATVDNAAGAIDGYWDSAAGQWQMTIASIGAGLKTLGQTLLNNIGPLGGMIKNAMSAAATGGPFAAIGSVMADMLTQSESFQNMLSLVTTTLTQLSQSLSPLIDAAKPLVDVALSLAQQLVGIAGQILTQVAPVIQMVGDMVAQILSALGPVLTTIGQVIGSVLTAIMPIVMMIMPVVQVIADVLSALAPVLNLLLVPLQIWASIMTAAKPIFDLFFVGIKYLMAGILMVAKGIGAVYNGILEGVASIVGLIPGLGDVANNIRKAKLDLNSVDLSISKMENSTNKATTSLDKFAPPVEKAAKAAEALSNVPSILKVTALRLQSAIAASSSPIEAARDASNNASFVSSQQSQQNNNSRNLYIAQMHVGGVGGGMDAMRQAAEKERYRLSGSTEASPYPNATPRVAGAH